MFKHKRFILFNLCIIFIFLFTLSATASTRLGPATPSESARQVRREPNTALGSGFAYQGFLKGSGSTPVTATCSFKFTLYGSYDGDDPVGDPDEVYPIAVSAGYFTTTVNEYGVFGSDAFNGQARWLQVEVKCGSEVDYTTLSPRQALMITPYASYATKVDSTTHNHWGQSWTGSGTGLTLNGGTTGLYARGNNSGVQGISNATSGLASGVYGESASTGGIGVIGVNTVITGQTIGVQGTSFSSTDYSAGVFGKTMANSGIIFGVEGSCQSSSDESSGVYGENTAISGANYGVYGYSQSNNGAGVYGLSDANSGTTYGIKGSANSSTGFGVYGSAPITGTVGIASSISGTTYGVYGSATTYGVYGKASYAGVYGESSSTSGTTFGVYGNTSSPDGYAVYGDNTSTNGEARGVYGISRSTDGIGVYGRNEQTSGTTIGVYGFSTSSNGNGVKGQNSASSGTAYGVHGISYSNAGNGIYGYAASETGTTTGVLGRAVSPDGRGVYGEATASSGTTFGVKGSANSSAGFGVHGSAPITGTTGIATSATGSARGVYGQSVSTDGYGGYFYNSSGGIALEGKSNTTTGDVFRLESDTNGLVFKVTGDGNVYADGTYYGAGGVSAGSADFAEMVPPGQAELEAGDVLVIDLDGQMIRSDKPYQTTVAGIYSTKPGFIAGNQLDEAGKPLEPERIPLAIVGIVPVKASAENGAIQPGDLLTTSDIPGHAMRAGPNPPIGTVIGKALQGLDSGTGMILVLVMLQ